MTLSEMAPGSLDRLKKPLDWDDFSHEPKAITHNKIRRAQELGVAAVLFTAGQTDNRIQELANLEHMINGDKVNNTVYASIMKGGIPFTGPLFTNIASFSPHMNAVVDYIQVSRYGNSQVGGSRLDVLRPLDPGTDSRPGTDIKGRRVVAVEDTIDEGITMDLFGKAAMDPKLCMSLGKGVTGPAKEVGIIALTDKGIATLSNFDPDSILIGMNAPAVWLGGRGLDGVNEALRWIPELVVTGVQHEKYREVMPEILDTLGERAVMGMRDITWIS